MSAVTPEDFTTHLQRVTDVAHKNALMLNAQYDDRLRVSTAHGSSPKYIVYRLDYLRRVNVTRGEADYPFSPGKPVAIEIATGQLHRATWKSKKGAGTLQLLRSQPKTPIFLHAVELNGNGDVVGLYPKGSRTMLFVGAAVVTPTPDDEQMELELHPAPAVDLPEPWRWPQ